ncbi:hypothetical protein QK287_14750, partial [Arthrobacter sp. AL05]
PPQPKQPWIAPEQLFKLTGPLHPCQIASPTQFYREASGSWWRINSGEQRGKQLYHHFSLVPKAAAGHYLQGSKKPGIMRIPGFLPKLLQCVSGVPVSSQA